MGGRGLIIILILLVVIGLGAVVIPKTGFSILQKDAVNENYLESLRVMANLSCLKDSQCSNGSACVANQCVDKSKIDLCENVKLYFIAVKLKVGDSINSFKRVISNIDLPYLLPDGELVDNVNEKVVEYFYSQIILVGSGQIQKENGNYVIKPKGINDPIYTYVLTFSNPVDFSSKDIQGQVLRILGDEYTIGSASKNSVIELISSNKKITLGGKSNNIEIVKNAEGKVLSVKIPFYTSIYKQNILAGENHVDNIFSKIKLNFNSMDEGVAEVNIGGNCL